MAPSTITLALQKLERRAEASLISHTTRQLSLTLESDQLNVVGGGGATRTGTNRDRGGFVTAYALS